MDETKPSRKIVVLGAGAVGKSAITIRMVANEWRNEYDPTIEDSYRKQVMIDDEPALLDILDTAGQEEFSSMQDQWMREGKGFLLVYSITSRPTFEECELLREKIMRTKDPEENEVIPMVLVGNKCDLEDQRAVNLNEGQKLAKDWGCAFFEASAKDKINNETCFYEVVRQIRKAEQGTNNDDTQKPKKKFVCQIL
mmetsp:Transcript_86867/g.106548  ORF Transcript_86867/g.106548 Transcript_86867/m.106548 type:complete len:196 (-) Transcript_86867:127-714(-)